MDCRPPSRRDAFTLIELLAALSLIAILVVLLLAGIDTLRDRGRTAHCMNNMRQIYAGLQTYLSDNDNRLMQRYYKSDNKGYDEVLAPYVKDTKALFTCPSQQRVRYPAQPGYGFNWYYDNQSILSIEQLSKTIALAETIGGGEKVGSHRADRDSKAPGQLDKERHRGRANYLFFDGHVETLKYEDTRRVIGKATDTKGREVDVDLWGVQHDDHQRESPL
jgi:prepilin-type processing-associated H-X9-DG protein/prepilin-type N-terminal cleavage/methylation domain-containing protein